MSDSVKASIVTVSVEETVDLGRRLGATIPGAMVVALDGPLGAGKTQLVKGIALGNGASDPREVTSPTFALVQEYHGRLHLYHVDAYRLANEREAASLGVHEMMHEDSMLVIEWAQRIVGLLPEDRLQIRMTVISEWERAFDVKPGGPKSAEYLLREFGSLSGAG